MKTRKPQDLMVSATGTWRTMPEPASPRREKTSLPLALGIRCPATLESVLKAIHQAAKSNQSSILSVPGDVGGPNEVLRVRPAREEGYAVVSVEALDGTPDLPDLKLLADLFDLTICEAQIASRLLVTEELRDIAEERHVSVETVRMHVKNILRKTGMPSQKKLTALLATLAMLSASSARSAG